MFLVTPLLLWAHLAQATPCGEAATARTQAASELLAQLADAEAIDKAALLERARILLERTLEEEPGCGDARSLKEKADGLVDEMQARSTLAAMEEALVNADRMLKYMEKKGAGDPSDLEALRFQLAELGRRLPGDERVEALAARAARIKVDR